MDDLPWFPTPAHARLAIVEGLLLALERWDEVSTIATASEGRSHFVQSIQSCLNVTEHIAQHIADLRLCEVGERARENLRAERAKTQQLIDAEPNEP